MAFKEEEYLQLSGLQHFSFCRRQWALIHMEQQWAENVRTTDGRILHEKAHDSSIREKRGDLIITRDMSIHSALLGVSGKCDVVEFHRGETGIPLPGQEGLWQPYPVEYKRGSPKITDARYKTRHTVIQTRPAIPTYRTFINSGENNRIYTIIPNGIRHINKNSPRFAPMIPSIS
jgi:CRISPR/Cas system-associated exonuclease Cas4 (RecB family)